MRDPSEPSHHDGERWCFAFVYENSQGHVTFVRHMRRVVEADPQIDATWFPIGHGYEDHLEQLPPFKNNLTMRMSLRARRRLSGLRFDTILFHTQQSALLPGRHQAHTPSLFSIDATPINVDQYAEVYGKTVGHPIVEGLKRRATAHAIHGAGAIVPWSDWCSRSVISDYGADPAKVEVIPPGLPLGRWRPRGQRRPGQVRLLFVGTKFARKGGPHLFESLRQVTGSWEIDVVNRDDDIPNEGRTIVHRDLSPDDDRLLELYQQADIFVFPTLGDALPLAVLEAMAAGLPVVSTRVGAIPEVVRDGQTGLLVDVGDVDGLTVAIQRMLDDPALRLRLGAAGRAAAEARHDASKSYARILELMKGLATASSQG